MPPYKPPPSGGLSAKGKSILKKVYTECRKDNPSDAGKEKCAKIAWGAVKKAGIKPAGEETAEALEAEINIADPTYTAQNFSKRITFGIDTGIPIFNRFRANPLGDGGDLSLVGTYLDFESTTNGWHIDPAEEPNLVSDEGLVTVRIAHSKDPKEVVGQYRKFWAADGKEDGCKDAYGNLLGRHVDFEAISNPQDPQLRVNIQKGWVCDISPGLDAEVFCETCNAAWGLDQIANKLIKTCEHQDAEGILRNIHKKEGSLVTEPAFEGRTRFHPTFTFGMAMNEICSNSPESNESEPLGTRVSPAGGQQAANDGRHSKKGSETQMVSSNDNETVEEHRMTAQNVEALLKEYGFKRVKAAKKTGESETEMEGEGEGEGEGEDDSETARLRAGLKSLKLLKKAEGDLAKLGYTYKSPGSTQTAEAEGEGESEMEGEGSPYPYKGAGGDNEGAQPPQGDGGDGDPNDKQGPPKPGGKGVPVVKGMSKEDQRLISQANAFLAAQEGTQALEKAKKILAEKAEYDKAVGLKAARDTLEKFGDKDGVARLDAAIAEVAKSRLEAQNRKAEGAEVPSADINFSNTGSKPQRVDMSKQQINPTDKARFDAAFKTEFIPAFRSSFRAVTFVKPQGAD